MKDFKPILASASPRRQEYLKLIFDDFDIIPSDVEEILPRGISVKSAPEYLARLKALDIAKKHPENLIIGADTCVIYGNKIFGKPKSLDEAFSMLKKLSGKSHKVITGCALVKGDKIKTFSVTTTVKFFKLSDSEITSYIATPEPYDKAGGYGIQSMGGLFVKGIKGDYLNVVGLPVPRLKKEIEKF